MISFHYFTKMMGKKDRNKIGKFLSFPTKENLQKPFYCSYRNRVYLKGPTDAKNAYDHQICCFCGIFLTQRLNESQEK
jgi:hypothetical protein